MLELKAFGHFLTRNEVESKVINHTIFEGLFRENNAVRLIFPTLWSVYQWVATVPPTATTAKRNFSKLKMVLIRLRTMMNDGRLDHFVTMCCETGITDKLKLDELFKVSLYSKPKRLNF